MEMIIAVIAVVIAAGAFGFSFWSFRERQMRDERNVRRDVLRRLVGNLSNLLIEGQEGTRDGEPYIALNEAMVVYADSPRVIDALVQMQYDLSVSGDITNLPQNLEVVLREMAKAADVPFTHMDTGLILYPFTAPVRDY